MRRIVERSHQEVVALLTANRGRLDALVAALLERETLDEEDAYAAAGVPRVPAGGDAPVAAAASTRVDG